jgi:hypothetical protein
MTQQPNKMKIRIGVMGAASGPNTEDESVRRIAYQVGEEVARRDCIMVTGACPGLPHDAARGAKAQNGFVVGVSPAFSHQEHIKEYKSPDDVFDIILYSGLGFMERDITNIRASNAIILLGGGIGTLNEFTVAFDEGKAVGILPSTKGISPHIRNIVAWCDREMNPNIVIEDDPVRLVDKLLDIISRFPEPVHMDWRVKDIKFGKRRG